MPSTEKDWNKYLNEVRTNSSDSNKVILWDRFDIIIKNSCNYL